MAAPASINPIIQRTLTDCMIAALAMLLGVDYLTVQKAASQLYKDWEAGLSASEAVKVAKKLKQPLRVIVPSPEDFDEGMVGVLVVRRGNTYHALVLFHGCLIDPSNGTLWEPATYFATTKRAPYKLLLP